MSRPCRKRKICVLPAYRRFAPVDAASAPLTVTLALDEFETLRQIDLEGLTQEQCAECMDVARTTVQAIYAAARRKLAACLVLGQELRIEGGDCVLCGGARDCPRRRGFCAGRQDLALERRCPMKIAVPYENGEIFEHFGHTERFKIYEAENDAVVSATVEETNGSGHGALAGFLAARGVNVLVCGGIGGGARQALDAAGIRLYPGVSGNADEAVRTLLAGTLAFHPDAVCRHHEEEHGEGHSCGEHGCGDSSCQSHCGK